VIHCFVHVVVGQPFGTSAFKKALEEAGSLSQEEFLIQFNVDILTPDLQHADTEVSSDGLFGGRG